MTQKLKVDLLSESESRSSCLSFSQHNGNQSFFVKWVFCKQLSIFNLPLVWQRDWDIMWLKENDQTETDWKSLWCKRHLRFLSHKLVCGWILDLYIRDSLASLPFCYSLIIRAKPQVNLYTKTTQLSTDASVLKSGHRNAWKQTQCVRGTVTGTSSKSCDFCGCKKWFFSLDFLLTLVALNKKAPRLTTSGSVADRAVLV